MRLIDADAFIADMQERYCKPCKERKEDYNEVRCRACWVDDAIGDVDGFADNTIDAVSEWIPCSERLPELTIHENEQYIGEWDNSEPVLIYHKDGRYVCSYLVAQYTNGFYDGKCGWTEANDANDVINVIAWMPLSEPWKGANDE